MFFFGNSVRPFVHFFFGVSSRGAGAMEARKERPPWADGRERRGGKDARRKNEKTKRTKGKREMVGSRGVEGQGVYPFSSV